MADKETAVDCGKADWLQKKLVGVTSYHMLDHPQWGYPVACCPLFSTGDDLGLEGVLPM